MHIKKFVSQSRRDFTAIYICEHCNNEEKGGGYDDSYFHKNVIPNKECSSCGKKASVSYSPEEPKYKPWEVV